MRAFIAAVWLAAGIAAPVRAQELGAYGAVADGNLKDVLQFGWGGGLSFTALYHARLGARIDAGFYESIQHYTIPQCVVGGPQPCLSTADVVTSRTPFDMQDAMVVYAPFEAEAGRVYVGAGVSHFSLSNDQVGENSGSLYSAKQSASGSGAAFMLSIIGRPQWQYDLAGEAMLTYHRTGRLRSCGAGEAPPRPPFCGSLGVTELRLGVVYAPRWVR